ncbi:MAG: glyoxylate/hydroxypyruvate reductase A [Proteobacteria bacterium]|nr:glyoxylate/hydroxypyruvate reductase A [Pseudomonadota bacterium]
MTARSTLLLAVPVSWAGLWTAPLAEMAPDLNVVVQGRDEYDPKAIDYALGFRPETGLLASLPNLKAVFSLGAGVDGFLVDPNYPKRIPLVRFVDHQLSREMAQYCVMHALIHHRQQRLFDTFQKEKKWRQSVPPRRTDDTRIGVLGIGEIGTIVAKRLRDHDFKMAGWSRTRKQIPGVESFAGHEELQKFLNRSDILICLLPLTADTRHILNAKAFSQLPKDAFVINVARGGHLKEDDLIAAIDSGHLSGATLDVFETEPLPDSSPLWSHHKITVTPHVAAISDPRVMAKNAVDGIARHKVGKPLDNVVDFARGY